MGSILGFYNRTKEPPAEQILQGMLRSVTERAVDGSDVWIGADIALASQHFRYTREAQFDAQPWEDPETGCIIAADACLTNRDELARMLDGAQGNGASPSHTLLILRAYTRWGVHCAEQLEGDFVFVIWDPRLQQLFLGRDALGNHSLCYFINDNVFVFGSEIDQVLAHSAVNPEIDEYKVADYLVANWNDHERTFFKGIRYLKPGCCLIVKAESERGWRYWSLNPERQIRYRADQEYAEHFLDLLKDATRSRLRGVNKVGVSLSGGLDSTTLAAVAANIVKESWGHGLLESFSYAFDTLTSCDERHYIRQVVDRHHIKAHFLFCDDKWTFRDPDTWPVQRDFVLSDPYILLPDAVMKAAQQAGCRVLLGGYYGDVLTLGGEYWASDMLRDRRWGDFLRVLFTDFRQIAWRKEIVRNVVGESLPTRLKDYLRAMLRKQKAAVDVALSAEFLSKTDSKGRVGYDPDDAVPCVRPGQQRRYQSLNLAIFGQGAASARRHYNRHGVELIKPYQDQRLVEFVFAIPADQMGRPARDRWVHRNATGSQLPEEVGERIGRTVFLPLLQKGLLRKERVFVDDLLYDPEIARRGYVRRSWLAHAKAEFEMTGHPDYTFWLCLCLELWLRKFW